MNMLKRGNVQIIDASVVKKEIRHHRSGHYCFISAEALFENGKPAVKDFQVCRWIYDYVSFGDDCRIIRYSADDSKNKKKDMDFVPIKTRF